jgi:cytochrome b561
MSIKSTATRYGSIAIALHWLSALAILMLFGTGLSAAAQADPAIEQMLVGIHVPIGLVVLLLTLARIGWWFFDRRPAEPEGGAVQKLAARLVHYALYAAILVLASSGIATLLLSGAVPALLAGTPLPDFSDLLPRLVHGVASKLMLVLLAAHVGAALYHQLIRRDRLLARMGIGTA